MVTYTWYLYPEDDHTNEVLSQNLPEENFLKSVLCSDNRKRPLWRCDEYRFVERIKGGSTLRYIVFVQEGLGQIRPWKLHKKKKKHNLVMASELVSRR